MEALVELEQLVLVAGLGSGFHLPHQGRQRLQVIRLQARHRQPQRLGLDLRAQFQEQRAFGGRHRRDHGAAVALADDQAVFLQPQHGLAHGALAAALLRRHFQFGHGLPGGVVRQHDAALEPGVDVVGAAGLALGGRAGAGGRVHVQLDIDNAV